MDLASNNILQELEAVVKIALGYYEDQENLPDEVTQELSNVIEAIFIHGLRDAFFLKGSRFSKYPEPNFWPFVSKFTHGSVNSQILSLKQIKSEVGKARAWIRIVLNEKALESYLNFLCRSENQLKVFYLKGAFIRDSGKIESLKGYLKSLFKVNISAPTNSSFLNSWTPTPLVLAGLISGKHIRVSQLVAQKRRNISSASLEVEDETEVAMNASDLLDESNSEIFSMEFSLGKTPEFTEEDDKSSIYSHPDGPTIHNLRPNFSGILSSTPENFALGASEFVPNVVELSNEVIVNRKRSRFRRTSKNSSEEGGSRSPSHSNSKIEDVGSRTQSLNKTPDIEKISPFLGISEPLNAKSIAALINTFDKTQEIESEDNTPSSNNTETPLEPSDSGIEQNNESEEKTYLDFLPEYSKKAESENEFKKINSENTMINSMETFEIDPKHLPKDVPLDILTEQPDMRLFGTSLKDELNFWSNDDASVSASSSVPLGDAIPRHASQAQNIFSSTETNFSEPMGTFKDALKTLYNSAGMGESKPSISESLNTDGGFSMSSKDEKTTAVNAKVMDTISVSKLNIADEEEEEEVVVIENDSLENTDEYGNSSSLTNLTKIPCEKGLDDQEFRCPSCRKSIGASFGTFKLCNFDCRYYCEDCCRRGDESIIPARVIWNWDCKPRPISQASKAYLKSIADRPLFRIDKINPKLYEYSQKMHNVFKLRTKLSLAVMYLLSCKQSIAEDIKRKIWPHDYWYSDIHLYSVMDIEMVISGSMERRLNSLITFAINHVNSCALCLQKGFICELCSSKRVIYPFQTEIAYRCKVCFSVYHLNCIQQKECAKCLRRSKFSSKFPT